MTVKRFRVLTVVLVLVVLVVLGNGFRASRAQGVFATIAEPNAQYSLICTPANNPKCAQLATSIGKGIPVSTHDYYFFVNKSRELEVLMLYPTVPNAANLPIDVRVYKMSWRGRDPVAVPTNQAKVVVDPNPVAANIRRIRLLPSMDLPNETTLMLVVTLHTGQQKIVRSMGMFILGI